MHSAEFMLPVQHKDRGNSSNTNNVVRKASSEAAQRAASMRRKFEFIDYRYSSPVMPGRSSTASSSSSADGTGTVAATITTSGGSSDGSTPAQVSSSSSAALAAATAGLVSASSFSSTSKPPVGQHRRHGHGHPDQLSSLQQEQQHNHHHQMVNGVGSSLFSPSPARRRLLGSHLGGGSRHDQDEDQSPALLSSVGPKGTAAMFSSPAFPSSLGTSPEAGGGMLLNDTQETPLFLPHQTPTKRSAFTNDTPTPESVSKNLTFSALATGRVVSGSSSSSSSSPSSSTAGSGNHGRRVGHHLLRQHHHHHHHHYQLPTSARKFAPGSKSPGIEMLAGAAGLLSPSPGGGRSSSSMHGGAMGTPQMVVSSMSSGLSALSPLLDFGGMSNMMHFTGSLM